jgi:hypothetical protein
MAVEFCVWQTEARGIMPGGRHAFYFEGKEPLVLWAVALLLFANTSLMLLLEFGSRYVRPKRLPDAVFWYSDHSILIQFILLALLAAIFITFRKLIHYVRPK